MNECQTEESMFTHFPISYRMPEQRYFLFRDLETQNAECTKDQGSLYKEATDCSEHKPSSGNYT